MAIKQPDGDAGYTIIESIIAMALLSIAIFPTARIITKVQFNAMAGDKLTAGQLAQAAMENALSAETFVSSTAELTRSGKRWRVVRSGKMSGALIEITVVVYKSGSQKPIAALQTLRLI